MRKLITPLFAICFAFGAQAQQQQQINKCYTYQHALEMMKNDPEMMKKFFDETEQLKQSQDNSSSKNPQTQNTVRIIPVVFHVIHEGGPENISRAQILDQMRILNEDYIRANPDTVNTPAPFASVAANCNIEFRLAQKDPSGNCTDGIVRKYSTLTNNADDNTKAVDDWPSTKYLNIWVVKSIAGSGPGTILGYAQFPGMGSPSTDGVMIRFDCIGSIGEALTGPFPQEVGRTATHEVGHWLNLRHIWGDNTCATDFVADTPVAQDANTGCPNFPFHVNLCNNTQPNGEMYCNYMDYCNGNCENTFTAGQKTRMDATLGGTRANLISASNLLATGTNTTTVGICAPIPDFFPETIKYICVGSSVSFQSIAYNGQPTAWNWTFPGGTPSTSTDSVPVIVYNTAGNYNVTLSVSNSSGTNAITRTAWIHVSSTTATYNSFQYFEGFESMASLPSTDWDVINNGGNAWNVITGPNKSGVKSAKLLFSSSSLGQVDELIGPSINLLSIPNPIFTFQVAYAQRSSGNTDKLQVYVSTNCGQTWSLRYTKSGATLATVPVTSLPFVPQNSEWRQETVNITPYTSSTNFRVKFVFTSDAGNNVYLDDINIVGASGVNEFENSLGMTLFPNPMDESSELSFTLAETSDVKIALFDLLGRNTASIFSGSLGTGEHQYTISKNTLEAGVYLLQVEVNGQRITKKVVIN